jgi:hypothetical protein
VGGVSERAGVKAGGIPIPSRINSFTSVAVKDILVVWKAALFAGRRRNEGLGRSDEHCGYPPAGNVAPMTAGVRRAPRRGTPSRMRHKAYAPDAGTKNVHVLGRRVLHSVLRPVHVNPHYAPRAATHGW